MLTLEFEVARIAFEAGCELGITGSTIGEDFVACSGGAIGRI